MVPDGPFNLKREALVDVPLAETSGEGVDAVCGFSDQRLFGLRREKNGEGRPFAHRVGGEHDPATVGFHEIIGDG